MNKVNWINLFFLMYISLFVVSCKGQSNVSTIKKPVLNCYILKPILHNEECRWFEQFPSLDTNMLDFFQHISFERDIKMDTTIGYITNFERQKRILINEECFNNLNKTDSIDLSTIYFYSRFNTSLRTGLKIEFLRSYKKRILNFGDALIFEYYLPNLSKIELSVFHIIIFDRQNRERGDDFEGIVISSDGLDWKEINNRGEVTPIHLTNLRGGMQIKVPLFFNKDEFIPIGHFRGGW